MPAKAGIQKTHQFWIPAFAGMTAYYDFYENHLIWILFLNAFDTIQIPYFTHPSHRFLLL